MTVTAKKLGEFFDTARDAMRQSSACDRSGTAMELDQGIDWAVTTARKAHDAGNKLMFIGNGGSAGIAGHAANDFSKNGDLRALAFNDGAVLTCLANDYGYEHVFEKQIEWHARAGDMLIAISSSGRSANILRAVDAARKIGCQVLTLSGFRPDNPLRALGDVNIHVPLEEYVFVEITHQMMIDSVLAFSLGWATEDDRNPGALALRAANQ